MGDLIQESIRWQMFHVGALDCVSPRLLNQRKGLLLDSLRVIMNWFRVAVNICDAEKIEKNNSRRQNVRGVFLGCLILSYCEVVCLSILTASAQCTDDNMLLIFMITTRVEIQIHKFCLNTESQNIESFSYSKQLLDHLGVLL